MRKGTWIVFGLVVVLGLLYFFTRENQVSVGVKQIKLPSFDHEKVDRIEVLGAHPVELFKSDTGWKLKLKDSAREVRADDENVKALLDAASSLRSSHYVTNLKEKYTELGLNDESAVTVKLSTNANTVFAIVLGKNATGAGRYARLPDEDDVFVVRGSFWQLTRNGSVDFRDREIWPVNEGELERLTVVKADGTQLLLAKDDQGWNFDKEQKGLPSGFRVDKSALETLVRTSASLRASGFVDDAKTLSTPKLTLKAAGTKGTHVLELFVDDKDKYFARRVGDEQIYEIAKNNFERLNQDVNAMRDLSVLDFDKSAIKSITLKHGKENVVVEKIDNQWKIVQPAKLPEKFEFDPNAVDDVLTLLSGLNAERIAGSKDTPVTADWQKTWLVELTSDKDEKIHVFATKTKANKEEFLVRGNIDSNVYIVKALRLSSLNAGVNAFKKEEFDLPPIDENTKGFESLPVDIQRKLLNVTKEKK